MIVYEDLKLHIQWSSFGFSVFFNLLLIYLILTKSPTKMGNYRYLMIFFSCFAIFFSTLDVLVSPYIHIHGKSFSVLMLKRNFPLNTIVEHVALCALCGCFGVTITFFAIHFTFRYFALERKGRLTYFHGLNFFIWLTIPVISGVIWGTTVSLFMSPNEETTAYLSQNILDCYNLPLKNFTYVAAIYWRMNDENQKEIELNCLISIMIFFAILISSFCIVCYYGYLSYQRITALMSEGESLYTKNLQRQLYKALVVQVIIPLVLMYVPFASYLILPVFEWDIQQIGTIYTFIYAIYPAIDPLPLFFIIDNYRSAITDFIKCTALKNRVQNSEHDLSQGPSSLQIA